jgi:hypothetical protein
VLKPHAATLATRRAALWMAAFVTMWVVPSLVMLGTGSGVAEWTLSAAAYSAAVPFLYALPNERLRPRCLRTPATPPVRAAPKPSVADAEPMIVIVTPPPVLSPALALSTQP